MSSSVSGLAASIRGATESETFDLGGHSVANITSTMTDAFSSPLPLTEMIRITFVTGAGKLGRQKYDENAAKAVTSALRALDFQEDRGASCVIQCAGSFKLQHDTGKNLKTVVVFPNISAPDANGRDDISGAVSGLHLDNSQQNDKQQQQLIPEGTPEYMIAVSSTTVFARMLTSKCPLWHQKKACLQALSHIQSVLEQMESKLFSGTPLSDSEQSLYDAMSSNALSQKEAHVKKEMQTHVESGHITASEHEFLLHQVSERIQTLSKEYDDAKSEQKPKKMDKFKGLLDKATERKEMLQNILPKSPPPLRNQPQINKLQKELMPLQKLEDSTKGRLLSLKETQDLARKDEILHEISVLEQASRGWFEDDSSFQMRLDASRALAKPKSKAKKSTPSSSSSSAAAAAAGGAWGVAGSRSKPATNFITPQTAKKKAPTKKPASKLRGGAVFAAMMMDSDSD